MDRKQLKAQSKTLIRTARPKPVVTAIIYLLILAVLSFLSYKLVGSSSIELQSVYDQFGINFGLGDGSYEYHDLLPAHGTRHGGKLLEPLRRVWHVLSRHLAVHP